MMRLIGLKTLIFIAINACALAEPKISYTIQDTYLQNLPSPFSPLTEEEKKTAWGLEHQIGKGFAKKLDLYRAITAFERAEILSPEDSQRKLEIDYHILLSYYLGKRYKDLELFFSKSPLLHVDHHFSPFHDLLVILYDSYLHIDQEEKAGQILQILAHHYPTTHQNLLLATHLEKGNLEKLEGIEVIQKFHAQKKSPKMAAILNALLPGSGYFYIGQHQTAITALLINALFIFAIIAFFKRKLIALAVIFLSFEMGWYGGGIYGGKHQANFFNDRLYEAIAIPYMNQEKIFPIYQLQYAY